MNPNTRAWLLHRIAENNIIGYILLANKPTTKEYMVGYIIGESYANNGYATEALKAMNNYTDSIKLNRVIASCLGSKYCIYSCIREV